MDSRQVLKDYIDACELVKETESDIVRLKKKQKTVIQTNVKGSNPDFPYQAQHFKVQGTTFTYQDDKNLRFEEQLLEERKKHAEQIKLKAQQVIDRAPVRIQRIIRMKYMNGLTWNQIADKLGRGATEDSVRKELDRFFEKK